MLRNTAAWRRHIPMQQLYAAKSTLFHTNNTVLLAKERKATDEDDLAGNVIGKTEDFIACAKDYLRPRQDKTLQRIPKSKEQFKKDEALANAYANFKRIQSQRLEQEVQKKNQLAKAALQALPEALQKEAQKIDWTPFPLLLQTPHVTPPQPGFELPDQPLRNEM